MLSKATKYSFKAISYLNKNSERKVSVREISNNLEIPIAFLAKTLQILVKQNVISSTKGANGGFYLSKENKDCEIINIIKAIDGVEKFEECFLRHTECDNKNPCNSHKNYNSFKKQLLTELSSTTIKELV